MKKLITRRGLIQAAGISAPALITRPSMAQLEACLPAFCAATAAPVCDIYWNNVVLLMGFNGANGDTGAPGFTDESPHAHGNASTIFGGAISTAQSVFGGSSARVAGGGNRFFYGDHFDWNLSTRRFTLEYRFHPLSVAFSFHVAQWSSFAGDLGWVAHSDTRYLMNVSTTGSNNLNDIASAAIFAINTWYAACIDFDGTKYRAYINGTMVASSTTLRTIFNSTAVLSFGAGAAGAFSFNGYFDELRLTMDVARYASDGGYTIATTAFPRIGCTSTVTWDAASVAGGGLINGDLTATNVGTTSADQAAHVATTHGKSTGKFYFEITYTLAAAGANVGFGVGTTTSTSIGMGNTSTVGNVVYTSTGNIYHNNVNSGKSLSALTTADFMAVALDLDNLKVWFRKGAAGLWNNTVGDDPATATGGQAVSAGTYIPWVMFGGTGGVAGAKFTANFGATAFGGVVPAGFNSGWAP